MKSHKIRLALGLSCLVALGAGSTWSAFTDTTENGVNTFQSGVLSITDNDGSSPLFTVTNMRATQTEERCIVVENAGSLPFDANTLTAVASADPGIDQALHINIQRGSGAVSTNDCAAFTPDPTNAVVFDGPIASLNSHAWAEPNVAVGARTSYKIVASMNNAPDEAQGDSASFQLEWEARDN
jgi:predicted ribosomally synthesized peptide with SipW-like signal peptide